jgi:hypothetical protein
MAENESLDLNNPGGQRGALTDVLEFLTDDSWELSFDQSVRPGPREIQRSLFSIPSDSRLCLYSGGLDSAAGLVNQIAADPTRHVVPVTVWHQPIQRQLVQRQYDLLRKSFGLQISPLISKAAMIWTDDLILHNGDSPEPIVRLLSQYRREWRDITARAAEQGFSWTKLVSGTNPINEGASRASA